MTFTTKGKWPHGGPKYVNDGISAVDAFAWCILRGVFPATNHSLTVNIDEVMVAKVFHKSK